MLSYEFLIVSSFDRNSPLKLLFECEIISGGVLKPRIVLRAFDTGMKTDRLSWKLSGRERASVGQGAKRLSLHIALLFPGSEIADSRVLGGLLNPLQYLSHRDKVDVVLVQNFIDPLNESIEIFGV